MIPYKLIIPLREHTQYRLVIVVEVKNRKNTVN
jgi:hypothetical protein